MAFNRDAARLTVELARLAYRDAADAKDGAAALGLDEFIFFDGAASTQAFLAASPGNRYLVFRGTESANPRDWATDARFTPISTESGSIHSGFDAGIEEVWDDIVAEAVGDDRPLTITGHSLGGALALLAASRLNAAGSPPGDVYVYGCPRIGLADFRDGYDTAMRQSTYRIINHIDIVTRVPLLTQGYRAPGQRMYFDGTGAFHQDASAWRIVKDDILFRLTHLRSIRALGLANHEIGAYRAAMNSL